MLTLRQAMELAGRNLVDTLSPAHGGMPFWNVEIDRGGRAACNMSYPSHNVGRWWDALLRLEAATGFAIPAEAEAVMLRHLESLFDNPLSVCGFLISQPQSHWKLVAGWVDDHSHRESLLALACLARYRGSRWALEQGRRVVAALDGYIHEDGTWDGGAMADRAHRGGVEIDPAEAGKASCRELTGTESHGRLIEALLEFFEVSGCEGAMRLAARLAEFHYDNITRADGSVAAAGDLHTHSLFGTYRGLLLYGCMTRQHQYIERIARTYRETVRTSVKESGFISHDWTLDTRGETTSPGDAAQLALWLARLGYGEFLDDAERIVRARILPSQITEKPGLTPMAEDGRDEHARLDERVLGAFGGMHRHPHGLPGSTEPGASSSPAKRRRERRFRWSTTCPPGPSGKRPTASSTVSSGAGTTSPESHRTPTSCPSIRPRQPVTPRRAGRGDEPRKASLAGSPRLPDVSLLPALSLRKAPTGRLRSAARRGMQVGGDPAKGYALDAPARTGRRSPEGPRERPPTHGYCGVPDIPAAPVCSGRKGPRQPFHGLRWRRRPGLKGGVKP